MVMMMSKVMWEQLELLRIPSMYAKHSSSCYLGFASACLVATFFYIVYERYRTYRLLTNCGLPTVFWTPKQRFFLSSPPSVDDLVSSSTITNILPRMQRLQGPLGMYGTVYGWRTPVIHVAHPVAAHAILCCSQQQQQKAPAYNHFTNFCGHGVFTADGTAWRAQRTAVLHALLRSKKTTNNNGMGVVEQIVKTAAEGLLERLEKEEEDCDALNIVPFLQRATIGMIYSVLTHRELLQDDDRSFTESTVADYLQSITNIRMILLAQSRSIWFLLPRWMYRMFAPLYRREEAAMGPIRRLAHHACRHCAEGSPLRQLRQLPLYQEGASGGGGDDVVSQKLLDEAITLLFAGQDTSAATLSWTLHLLSQHPKAQERLANELQVNGGQEDDEHRCYYYLDAVLKESMRLYPVAPFVVRKLTAPVTLPKTTTTTSTSSTTMNPTTTTLPKDTLACIWIYSLHRNPAIWKDRPNDFVPERWLQHHHGDDSSSSSSRRIPPDGAYLPFAAGPRQCLGQPLAQKVVLRTLCAAIVRTYKVVPSNTNNNDTAVDMQAGFTVLPRGGLMVRLQRRLLENKE